MQICLAFLRADVRIRPKRAENAVDCQNISIAAQTATFQADFVDLRFRNGLNASLRGSVW